MSNFLTFGVQNTPSVTKPQDNLLSDGTGWAKVTTSSGSLNLRLSPEPYASVLTTIPKGRVVEVYSVNDGWAMVSYQGYAGYVMTAYLTMQTGNDAAAATPEPNQQQNANSVQNQTQSPQQTPPTVSFSQEYTTVEDLFAVAGAGSAYLRPSPSMNDRILQVFSAGECIEVVATSPEWCIVQWKDMLAYINLREVSLYHKDALH